MEIVLAERGGFDLSTAAVEKLAEHGRTAGDVMGNRGDPKLVEVVKELGPIESGLGDSRLHVVEAPYPCPILDFGGWEMACQDGFYAEGDGVPEPPFVMRGPGSWPKPIVTQPPPPDATPPLGHLAEPMLSDVED